MTRQRRRTLTLADGMVLIAASAVGLAVFEVVRRSVLGGNYRLENLLKVPPAGWTTGQVLVRGVQFVGPLIPFAGAWTFVVPILRLSPPRPPRRRRWSQPGVVACLAAMAGLVWAALGLAGTLTIDRLASDRLSATPERWPYHFVVEELFAYLGLAVAASWIGVALTGRWRASEDWIDRFGRILGVFWIVTGLVWACRRYLWIVVF